MANECQIGKKPSLRLYAFTAMDSRGGEVKDTIEATSEEDAREAIRRMGYFVTKLYTKLYPPTHWPPAPIVKPDEEAKPPKPAEKAAYDVNEKYRLDASLLNWPPKVAKKPLGKVHDDTAGEVDSTPTARARFCIAAAFKCLRCGGEVIYSEDITCTRKVLGVNADGEVIVDAMFLTRDYEGAVLQAKFVCNSCRQVFPVDLKREIIFL